MADATKDAWELRGQWLVITYATAIGRDRDAINLTLCNVVSEHLAEEHVDGSFTVEFRDHHEELAHVYGMTLEQAIGLVDEAKQSIAARKERDDND